MSLIGTVLLVILILILLGGICPHYYPGAPWTSGYGYGWPGNGALGIILIIILILAFMGHL